MYDAGYDIADFKAIQPEYGTMEDFENLFAEAAKLGNKYFKLNSDRYLNSIFLNNYMIISLMGCL